LARRPWPILTAQLLVLTGPWNKLISRPSSRHDSSSAYVLPSLAFQRSSSPLDIPLHPPRRSSQAARYTMSQGLFATVRKTFFEISQERDIPARLLDTLESQLVILCTTYRRQIRSESSRARRDIKSRNRHKRAQALYVDILDEVPHLFLPVILVATPRACEKLRANEFRRIQTGDCHIELCQSVKKTFEEIAGRNGLEGSPRYRKLIRTLFPPSNRPVTTAERGGYEYLLPDTARASASTQTASASRARLAPQQCAR
jgi:hypothetical protein